MMRYVCNKRELSCIIPLIFKTLEIPCCYCNKDINDLVITGTTHNDKSATIILRDYGFDYYGESGQIEKVRGLKCIHEKD